MNRVMGDAEWTVEWPFTAWKCVPGIGDSLESKLIVIAFGGGGLPKDLCISITQNALSELSVFGIQNSNTARMRVAKVIVLNRLR